jgi:hypothetical protein
MPHLATLVRPVGRAAALILALAAAGCAVAPQGTAEPEPEAAPPVRAEPVKRERRYVLIDVEENVLRFMDGDRVLWQAPVGTGTGFRLRDDSGEWHFSTPTGTMHVQYKEMNPVWEIPDWYFIENRLPVPPEGSPLRKQANGLGAAAVYLGDEIAIHGTDRPELLGKRVSHGCIRLSNANALRLFHDVQIGTPVMIVGQVEVLNEEMPDSAAAFTRPRRGGDRRPPWRNPREGARTADLLRQLDRDLAAAANDTAWVLSASALMKRGLADDSLALRGLLSRAATGATESRRREFAGFLADAFSRGSFRASVSLSKIGEDERNAAAAAIVDATMRLYHGPLDATAPWPTKRVPKWRLGPQGQSGWTALADAEARFRAEHGGTAPAAAGERR